MDSLGKSDWCRRVHADSPYQNLSKAAGAICIVYLIGGALRPRLSGKPIWNVHGPDGRARNAEAGLNIVLYSDWL